MALDDIAEHLLQAGDSFRDGGYHRIGGIAFGLPRFAFKPIQFRTHGLHARVTTGAETVLFLEPRFEDETFLQRGICGAVVLDRDKYRIVPADHFRGVKGGGKGHCGRGSNDHIHSSSPPSHVFPCPDVNRRGLMIRKQGERP